MSAALATSFRVCLAAVGLPRKIVIVSEICTLGDLYHMAIETFYAPEKKLKTNPMISLSSGFPPKPLDNCSKTTVQSVLSSNDRVNVILMSDKTSRSRTSMEAMTSSQDKLNDSENTSEPKCKRPRLDVANGGLHSLKVLTWNIAECRPSHDAPDCFDCETAILRQIVNHEAHILCLQECPSESWIPPELLESYALVGSAPSHCGMTQLWIHNTLDHQQLETIPPPSVAATVLLGDQIVGISSSHLTPFKEGASHRLQQATNLYQLLSEVTPNFIMAGDFNMRQAEDCKVERLGLHDVFKLAGAPKHAKFTWDSIRNTYHGPGAFGFRCRFDRTYVSYDNSQPKVTLVGDQPEAVVIGSDEQEQKFYLSDHFGMLCTLQIPKKFEV
jgi:endonuclease/exonuclease/phosphatase family metal-dependent hydrolase